MNWKVIGLLGGAAVLYVWGLGASGWANPYYSAAVQAGAQSWKAFFFGSSDAANAITVDKTPASLWPMVLSARLFGVNAWSVLVPQALMGVATVGVVYASVRRRAPEWAALLAGVVMAVTPVAVLMFRFNNPDALLVLLLCLAAYCLVRAQEGAATRWVVAAGALVGFAFLAKMLQAFLVLPGFAVVYLVSAPTSVWRRLWQLLLAGGAMVVAAGWWVLAVALVPAGERPYIGGSQGDSVLELALGYNGIGRLNGDDYGGLGNLNQEAGWFRLFDSEAGGQVSWLLPAALVLLAAAVWVTRRAGRDDPMRASLAIWGSWLLVTGVIFSLMQGIFHAYYTVALAPAIAALVGLGAAVLWERRAFPVLASVIGVSAVWGYVLLSRSPEWNAWLGPVVLVAGAAAALGLAGAGMISGYGGARDRMLWAVGGVGVLVVLAGPAAYAMDTAATPHTGAIPAAGPSTGGGGSRALDRRRPGAGNRPMDGRRPGGGQGGPGGPGGQGGPGGGRGGLLGAVTPGAELTALLKAGAARYTWVAATVGSNNAAGYQLATGLPVMAVGGFNGTDPAPTLARFRQYVAEGRIHYFLPSGLGRGPAAEIAAWVERTYDSATVAGTTVFDLTRPR
ncbi:ArnT family glycosyltransferase [Nonomuraea sp. NPDC050394]|uniref:ArnT family glycosyltransferase n=1 Tax=Nonomuraea sp. NPDC050394 TaxID=3364363 RepID=UPI00378CDF04